MPVETAKTAPQEAAQNTPKKKPASSGKAAVAKVTLLDGSILEITIEVNIMII